MCQHESLFLGHYHVNIYVVKDMSMRRTIEPKILYMGTPVVLISTMNENDTPNLAPISSAWSLGWNFVLGLGVAGKTFENLMRSGECVLNFPSDDMWREVELLAPLTGKNPVPSEKPAHTRYESDKFRAAGLTALPSELVRPPAVVECPISMEAKLTKKVDLGEAREGICGVEVRILRVHARPDLVIGNHYIDPEAWRPLIYNFRHYFGLGRELGRSYRSEIPSSEIPNERRENNTVENA